MGELYMLEFLKIIFSCLLFWKYFFEEKGSERDLKLKEIHKGWFVSNKILFLAALLFYKLDIYNGVIFTILVILIIWQSIFQFKTNYKAIKRVYGVESLRKELKEGFSDLKFITGVVLKGVGEDLVDELKKIIDEFYVDYKEKSNTYQEQSYRANQEQTRKEKSSFNKEWNNKETTNFDNDNDNDETSEIERILIKYDLMDCTDLGVIKKRFRNLAKKYHPDMPTGDEKSFIELREDMEYLMKYYKRNMSA
jgi:hypothetical protein